MRPSRLLCLVLVPVLLSGGCRKEPAATNPPLLWAAKIGDVQAIAEQLSRGTDVNAKDADGWTAHEGHIEAAELLITEGADVNAKDKDGWTPLFLALGANHNDVVALLAAHGADVNVQCGRHHETPLLYAIRRCNVEAVELIINCGADPSASDENGVTPLHDAVSPRYDGPARSLDLIRLLIAQGAAVNARAKSGWTPLHSASSRRYSDGVSTPVVELLIGARANLNSKNNEGDTPLHLAASVGDCNVVQVLVNRGADIDAVGAYGETPLERALSEQHKQNVEVAKLLLGSGADIGNSERQKVKRLFLAATSGFKDLAKRLIDQGVNVEAARDKVGWTPLHCALWYTEWDTPLPRSLFTNNQDAAREDEKTLGVPRFWIKDSPGHREVAQLLIEHGVDVNIRNPEGDTALHEAVRADEKAFARILFAHGADVNAKGVADETPLHIAAWEDKYDMAQLLLAHGADANAQSLGGPTPLHTAARGHKYMVNLLLANGADVNLTDASGDTPLHKAALRGQKDIVELLLAHGADVDARDNSGRTPLDEAARRGHTDIIALLKAKMTTPAQAADPNTPEPNK